jgi:biopolymer transport protein ExbB
MARLQGSGWAYILLAFFAVALAAEIFSHAGAPTTSVASAQNAEAPAEGGEEAAPAGKAKKTMLVWFFEALGIKYTLAFLALSFTFVAVLVMNILSCRRDSFCPKHLGDAFEAHLQEKRFQEAFDLAKADESFLGQMLAAGMTNLQQGYDKAMQSMGEVGEDESMKVEHRLSYISLVGAIAPMVGLLGTVDGMVASFQTIALNDSTPKASELAGGISMALITTLVGLVLAIPAIISFNLLKNRFSRLQMEAGQTAGRLFSRFETMGKK